VKDDRVLRTNHSLGSGRMSGPPLKKAGSVMSGFWVRQFLRDSPHPMRYRLACHNRPRPVYQQPTGGLGGLLVDGLGSSQPHPFL
jgi:hypothetical protein